MVLRVKQTVSLLVSLYNFTLFILTLTNISQCYLPLEFLTMNNLTLGYSTQDILAMGSLNLGIPILCILKPINHTSVNSTLGNHTIGHPNLGNPNIGNITLGEVPSSHPINSAKCWPFYF